MIGTHYDDLKKKIYNADLQENCQEAEKTILEKTQEQIVKHLMKYERGEDKNRA